MDQRGDARAAALDERGHAARVLAGQLDRLAVDADVGLVLGHPVGELERRVAQRAGERVAQRAGLGGLAQVDEQVADRRAREAGAQQADEEDRSGPADRTSSAIE